MLGLACLGSSPRSHANRLDAGTHRSSFNPPDDARAALIEVLTGETVRYSRQTECERLLAPELEPPSQNGHIVHLHLHKCAGTTTCDLARANMGASVMDSFQAENNCAALGDGNWLARNGIEPGFSVGCEERKEKARTHPFFMIERWLDSDAPCDNMKHSVVIRDPIDRIVSNVLFTKTQEGYDPIAHSPAQFVSWAAPGKVHAITMEPGAQGPSDAMRGSDMIERSTAAVDNFYVRSFAGPEAFMVPAGQLGQEHLEKAKNTLRSFSVVIMLEKFDTQSAQYAHSFGWQQLFTQQMLQNHTKDHGHQVEVTIDTEGNLEIGQSTAEVARATSEDVFSEEELETLVTANQLDYEAPRHPWPLPSPPPHPIAHDAWRPLYPQFFCYAKQIAAARTEFARAAGATSALQQLEKLVRDKQAQERSAYPPLPAFVS